MHVGVLGKGVLNLQSSSVKGLILAAGRGTRLAPLTDNLPKPLIEINDKPMILNCIGNLLSAGIFDIGIVINKDHEVMFKEALRGYAIYITYIYQNVPDGVAGAIGKAYDFIGHNPFIVVLGDNYITNGLNDIENIAYQLEVSNRDCMFLGQEVDNPKDYGIIMPDYEQITKIVEKPEYPKTNLAVMGLYGFSSKVFYASLNIKPSARGEYEITDVINYMIKSPLFKAGWDRATGNYIDVGTHDRLAKVREANKSEYK